MRLAPIFLAVAMAASHLGAQEPGTAAPGRRPPAAAARGAAPRADDTFSIPASPAANGPLADPAGEDGSVNLWEVVKSGGWAMYPLGFMSVMTVMLLLTYIFTLRRGAILTPHFMNTADVLLKKRDYLGLLAISSRHSEVVARIVQRALDFATKNPGASIESVRDIAETEGGAQAAILQHRITYLADIGVLAPMVGLLGTVFGIIRAFRKLSSGEASVSRDILLASGVSEALIATAAGLILGVVAMGFYGIFRNRVHSLISDMEIATAHIMGLLTTNFGKKRESSRVAVEEEF
jgi:biopolymer transport protein ExbB